MKDKSLKHKMIIDMCNIIIKAILAGMCISIGAIAGINTGNKVGNAVVFGIGLWMCMLLGAELFTGNMVKATRRVRERRSKLYSEVFQQCSVLICNCIGVLIVVAIARTYNMCNVEMANTIYSAKSGLGCIEAVIKGIMCNVLICIAVMGCRKVSSLIERYIICVTCVFAFIMCGFEHCIADMFYIQFCDSLFNIKNMVNIVCIIIGNIIGGVLVTIYCDKEHCSIGD